MKDELIVLVPLIGVLGIVIGALLQAFLSRKNQKASSLSELQNKAYSDFLIPSRKLQLLSRTTKEMVSLVNFQI